MKKKDELSQCAEKYIGLLQEEGRHATAHVYKNALLSFSRFCGTTSVSFGHITRESLRRYNQYLFECRLKPNTVSTYIRMLRSIYNQGVESGQALYVPRLFRDVYTGVDIRQKKAIPVSELHKFLYGEPPTEELRRTQQIASLMFQFSGMPFADIAHLEMSALDQDVLRYNRIKTGVSMSVEILDTAKELVYKLRNKQTADSGAPNYLFNILSGKKSRKDEEGYREYQSTLRRFNNQLRELAKAFGLRSPITSYTFRHSWATMAKYRGVPIEMISESLGHKSIKTTQIYLKGFELEERTKINRMNLCYVKNAKGI